MTAPALDPRRHYPSCGGSDANLRSWQGRQEQMMTCNVCRRTTIAQQPTLDELRASLRPATPPPTAPRPRPSLRSRSRYRCRVHTDRPVTWRGTGCPECEAEHHARGRRTEPADGQDWPVASQTPASQA